MEEVNKRHVPRAASAVQTCADEWGFEVAALKQCVNDPETLRRLKERQEKEYKRGFWATVSPFAVVKGEHIPRIETLPSRVCEAIGWESEACRNLPEFTEGRGYCMITVI